MADEKKKPDTAPKVDPVAEAKKAEAEAKAAAKKAFDEALANGTAEMNVSVYSAGRGLRRWQERLLRSRMGEGSLPIKEIDALLEKLSKEAI